jgi:hypothetical protein
MVPFSTAGNYDLGATSFKWHDLYLTGGIEAAGSFGTAGQVLTSNGTTSYWSSSVAGTITANGTPVDNQVAVFTGADEIEGDANLTWDGSQLATTGTASFISGGVQITSANGGLVDAQRVIAPFIIVSDNRISLYSSRGLTLASGRGIHFNGTANWWETPDLVLERDAANTLAQRNGTNAQTFNIYNTYTDASNYERGFLKWDSNSLYLGTEATGTGSNRNLVLDPASGQIFVPTGTGTAILGSYSNGTRLLADNGLYLNGYNGGLHLQTANGPITRTRIEATPGILTTSSTDDYGIQLTQILNVATANSGAEYRALKINVTETDTTGWDNVYLFDAQVGGTSLFKIGNDGKFGRMDNQYSAWTSAQNTIEMGGSGLRIYAYGQVVAGCYGPAGKFHIGSYSTNYTFLKSESTGTLALEHGTTATGLNLYNTYTDASNYERGFLKWNTNKFVIGTEALGTGTNRNLHFEPATNVVEFGSTSSTEFTLQTPQVTNYHLKIIPRGTNNQFTVESGIYQTYKITGNTTNGSITFDIAGPKLGVRKEGTTFYEDDTDEKVKLFGANGDFSNDFGKDIEFYTGGAAGANTAIDLKGGDFTFGLGRGHGTGSIPKFLFKTRLGSVRGTDHAEHDLVTLQEETVTIDGAIQVTNTIDSTSTDGLVLENTTASTSGQQQWSPRIRLSGEGYRTNTTAESKTLDWIIENQTVSGVNTGEGYLTFSYQTSNVPGYHKKFVVKGKQTDGTWTSAELIGVAADFNITGTSGSNDFTFTRGASYHSIQTWQNKPLLINSLGNNVSIGNVTNPTYKLVVARAVNGTSNLLRLHNTDATYSQTWDFQSDTAKDLVVTGGSGSGGVVFSPGTNGLSVRNGANAQKLQVYNTYTNNTNYERGSLEWSSNVFLIEAQYSGTGASRYLRIKTGVNYFELLPTSGQINFSGGTRFKYPSNGTLEVRTSANVPGDIVAGTYSIYTKSGVGSTVATQAGDSATLTTTTATQIASFATTHLGAKLVIQAADTVSGERQMSEIMLVHDGTTVTLTEYGVIFTNASLATYTAEISGGNVVVKATSASTNSTTYKVMETLI